MSIFLHNKTSEGISGGREGHCSPRWISRVLILEQVDRDKSGFLLPSPRD